MGTRDRISRLPAVGQGVALDDSSLGSGQLATWLPVRTTVHGIPSRSTARSPDPRQNTLPEKATFVAIRGSPGWAIANQSYLLPRRGRVRLVLTMSDPGRQLPELPPFTYDLFVQRERDAKPKALFERYD